jgi:hypothetical protein
MGIVTGEPFEDLGNTIEYTVSEVRAYERLSGDRVRLYVTEERGNAHVLQYTLVAPISAFAGFMRVCSAVAGNKYVLPDWALGKPVAKIAH